ncbi:UDP-N-acetylmuramoyl-L-alanyl-D-glutamate--2,6-diaminopimelate ligase [Rhodocyclus tenuis]|uniref:UDP-N-acetylmuramoyl-L-alanyl-D-glutamate--2, 6-diaminopimelate ligase n=1 Tax=Rhodocyclus gracilis TaxID=2929842 RepID=UPI0013556AC5|nr:UDP-N-acetylmuramoyl-L-alanyl-D-glutamate--2,6-diaminopimelate ligase [Rhodocyclus gracilis]
MSIVGRDVFVGDANGALAELASQGAQIRGAADDSRRVRAGDVFLAYPGDLADGRNFIADAVARGAVAVVWEAGGDFVWPTDVRVPNLPVARLRAFAGALAHAACARPTERLSLIAVTGTNGKTSISQWIAQTYPRPCGVIGTLGVGLPGKLADTGFTTPQAATLARTLADFVADEASACAIEASSIGIEEGRLNAARVDVAVFTNLTRDHLDYHGSMAAYAAAKEKLFTWPRLRLAVINLDDPFGRELASRTTATRIIGYSQAEKPPALPGLVLAENVMNTPEGMSFRLVAPNGRAYVDTPLIGRFNISNLLAVAAVLIDAGMTPRQVAERFATLSAPPGRLETLGGGNQPLVVVDYAHTPDALSNALTALRDVARARGAALRVVFGCGGDRDAGKRPLMGEIATQLADSVTLTSDNPRSEDPHAIIEDIRRAAPTATVIADRASAIQQVISAAHPADVILLAGKGHEPYQEINGVRRPFSDHAEAGKALATRLESFPQ